MINGAHVILYSKDSDADRAFFRDVLALTSVDVGGGWLIFGLPPAEIAVHPTDGEGGTHELYLMCEDVEQLIAQMTERQIVCGPIENRGWGLLTNVTLPGGSQLGVYQPRHARPEPAMPAAAKPAAKRSKPAAKQPARKPAAKRPPAKRPAAKRPAAKRPAAKRPGKQARR
jgi:hypothetical protein